MPSSAKPLSRAACPVLAILLAGAWCGCVDLPSPVIPSGFDPDRPAFSPMNDEAVDSKVEDAALLPLWFNNSAPLIISDAGMIAVPQTIDAHILQVPRIVDPIATRVLVPSP